MNLNINYVIAVLFEMEKYDECIEISQKAVDVGRELRADYKLIARLVVERSKRRNLIRTVFF